MKTFGLAKAGLAKEVYYNVVIVKYHSLLVQDHWEFSLSLVPHLTKPRITFRTNEYLPFAVNSRERFPRLPYLGARLELLIDFEDSSVNKITYSQRTATIINREELQ